VRFHGFHSEVRLSSKLVADVIRKRTKRPSQTSRRPSYFVGQPHRLP
jgi:hypothetical protein